MNAKKKMIIAISAFAMVILATVVAVIAVLAAQNVTVKSSLNVSYSVEDIHGSARVSYKLGSASTYTTWKIGGKASATFDGTTTDGAEFVLDSQPFSLNETNSTVIIKFEFQKSSASVENFSAQLDASVTKFKNITVEYGTTEAVEDGEITATGSKTL